MWFAVYVRPGCEAQAVELLRATPKSGELEEVFCPMAEYLHREDGERMVDMQPMFEGLVFAIAPSKWELRACVKQADGLQVLVEGRRPFEPMREGEEEFVNAWAPASGRIAAISEAEVDESGRASVIGGPLLGHEGEIARYGARHRRAFLETNIAGELARACLGVRVTKDESLHPWEEL